MPEAENQEGERPGINYYLTGFTSGVIGCLSGFVGAIAYLGHTPCDWKMDSISGSATEIPAFILGTVASLVEGISFLPKYDREDISQRTKIIKGTSSYFLLSASNLVLSYSLGQIASGAFCPIMLEGSPPNTTACDADIDTRDCFNFDQLKASAISVGILTLIYLHYRDYIPHPLTAVSQCATSFYGRFRRNQNGAEQLLHNTAGEQQESTYGI